MIDLPGSILTDGPVQFNVHEGFRRGQLSEIGDPLHPFESSRAANQCSGELIGTEQVEAHDGDLAFSVKFEAASAEKFGCTARLPNAGNSADGSGVAYELAPPVMVAVPFIGFLIECPHCAKVWLGEVCFRRH